MCMEAFHGSLEVLLSLVSGGREAHEVSTVSLGRRLMEALHSFAEHLFASTGSGCQLVDFQRSALAKRFGTLMHLQSEMTIHAHSAAAQSLCRVQQALGTGNAIGVTCM
jgi:hypothetical protein